MNVYEILHREVFGIAKPHEVPNFTEEPEHKYCKWCEEMIYKHGSNFCSARCEQIYDSQKENRFGLDRIDDVYYFNKQIL